jgi:hypothetical protein
MDINEIAKRLNRGQQLGKSFSYEKDGEIIWVSVGVQFWNKKFVAYVDEIEESKMTAEDFIREDFKKFDSLEGVKKFLIDETSIFFSDLRPLKGQKIFNPRISDED